MADSSGGLLIVDLSDVAAPEIMSRVPTPGEAEGVSLHEGIAYVAMKQTGLLVVDVKDKFFPKILGNPAYPLRAYGVEAGESAVFVAGGNLTVVAPQCSEPITSIDLGETAIQRRTSAVAVPNPTHGPTRLRFVVGVPGPVQVEVFDVRGRRVRTLLGRNLASGHHEVAWDGRDAFGGPVAAGVYLYRVHAPRATLEGRLQIIR